MIQIDDTLLAIWFLQVSICSNWVLSIHRGCDGALMHRWRMRYYPAGSGLFDQDEQSSWYEACKIESIEDAVERVRGIVRVLSEHAEGPLFESIRGARPVEEFMRELIAQPWIHFRAKDGNRSDVTFKLVN